ncbi:hypothetical protein [Nonomuraea sp. NPDC049646]|uniref:hypothetical protein n=1 Tax=unclassified Nonomuraea TaxID=2593643 RepID=UPI003792C06A
MKARQGTETWTHRLCFAWDDSELPAALRESLTTGGGLKDRGLGEYAWTVSVTGDVGAGTAKERADRAAWLAADTLAAHVAELGEHAALVRLLATEAVRGDV